MVATKSGSGGADGAFPRGGGDSIAVVERKRLRLEAQAEAARDFAAEQELEASAGASSSKKRRKGKPGVGGDDDDLFSKNLVAPSRLPRRVDLLKFKSLAEGMRLLGVVSEVTAKEVTVALPHGLRGQVSAAEASDLVQERMQANAKAGVAPDTGLPSLTELFSPGQHLVSTIVKVGDGEGPKARKRIDLSTRLKYTNAGLTPASLKPGMVVSACVKSAEDHGYTLTLAIRGASAFLRKSKGDATQKSLVPGSLLDVIVVETKGKVVIVSSDAEELAGAVSKQWDGLTIDSLRPGAMVNARVAAVMKDGLSVTFLTFFSGTIDRFHLSKALVGDDWATKYSPGQKLLARILYVDPTSKVAGLSLAKHLLDRTPAQLPPLGRVYDNAVVRRIDASVGLLIELPAPASKKASKSTSAASSAVAFVHVSNISEAPIKNLEKQYKCGQAVKARVIGHRLVDGVAVGTMRPDVVEQQLLSHSDVKVGATVKGTVAAVEDFGIIVQLTPTIKAVCPTLHMSDSGAAAAKKKFPVGKDISARVLSCNTVEKKIVLTMKKQLCKPDSPIIATLADAEVGKRTYGVVTGLKDFGLFVAFFGGTTGLVRTSDLGLKDGESPDECFQVGQVIRPRVISVDSNRKRIMLTLNPKKKGEEEEAEEAPAPAVVAPGDLVEGKVDRLDADDNGAVAVSLVLPNGKKARGFLPKAHLSDHPDGAAALLGALKPGSSLGELLVLEAAGGRRGALVTRKQSMRRAVASLPSTVEDVAEAALLPGYVASVTPDAVYVRFLARVTGRAGLSQLADTFVSDAQRHFSVGQSVRAQVVQVDAARGKFSVTLKSALTMSSDASLLGALFEDLERAEELSVAEGTPVDWSGEFSVGAVVEGEVHELKEYGVVCDLRGHPDLLGLVAPHQQGGLGEAPSVGQHTKGRLLDVNKRDGILDLSSKAELCKAPKKAIAKAVAGLSAGEAVEGVVELVKDSYIVASIPKLHHALGFLSAKDYNLQIVDAHKRFAAGQKVSATVAALPAASSGGRLLLHAPLSSEALGGPSKGSKHPRIKAGDVVEGVVDRLFPVHASIRLGEHLPRGRVYVSHVDDVDSDDVPDGAESPLRALSVGQKVKAVVLGNVVTPGGAKRGLLELSMRPSDIERGAAAPAAQKEEEEASVAEGASVVGYCHKLKGGHVWVVLSPTLRGRAELLDCSSDPLELEDAESTFAAGRPLKVRVVSSAVQRKQKGDEEEEEEDEGGASFRHIDLAVLPAASEKEVRAPGSLQVAQVTKVVPGRGLHLVLRGGVKSRCGLTDIHDALVPDALGGFREGGFVRGRVLEKASSGGDDSVVELSLRPSAGGWWPGCDEDGSKEQQQDGGSSSGPASASALSDGQSVKGYIKSVTPKGVFVALSGTLTARVKLRNLSDGFVEDPKAAFPIGRLVSGKVLSAEGGLVEMTLRSGAGGGGTRNAVEDLEALEEGETVTGSVRRVSKFGVFVQLDKSALTGMVHISELQDGVVKSIQDLYQTGQRVRARVLSVDTEAKRLSLGLKPSYFDGDAGTPGEDEEGEEPNFDEEAQGLMEDEDEGEESGEEEEEMLDIDAAEASEEDEEDEEEEEEEEDEAQGIDAMEEDGSDDDDDEEEEEEEEDAQPSSSFMADSLEAADAGYSGWGEVVLGDESSAADGADDEGAEDDKQAAPGNKKTKGAKKAEAREKEAEMRRAELSRLQGSGAPTTKEQFEQAVMADPNSSYVWIKYMAFLVTLGEVAAARKAADRALATIGQREEAERFNVWVAYINLENIYGEPPEEAVMSLMGRALQYTNQKKLYMAALSILQRTRRDGMCQQVLKAMCRKFPESAKVWLRAYSYHVEASAHGGSTPEAARRALDRGLDMLPKRKHIKVLTQVGITEFKAGDAERGRSVFEDMVRNYPKRMDLWSVYLDQEIRAGDKQRSRTLFERVTHLHLPAKKMKFLFKRFLDFEKQHGTPSTVEHVKKRAMEFAASLSGGA